MAQLVRHERADELINALINALIDESAGTESGRITSLNPAAAKKKTA